MTAGHCGFDIGPFLHTEDGSMFQSAVGQAQSVKLGKELCACRQGFHKNDVDQHGLLHQAQPKTLALLAHLGYLRALFGTTTARRDLSGRSSAVERHLAKVDVVGSIPIARSNLFFT